MSEPDPPYQRLQQDADALYGDDAAIAGFVVGACQALWQHQLSEVAALDLLLRESLATSDPTISALIEAARDMAAEYAEGMLGGEAETSFWALVEHFAGE